MESLIKLNESNLPSFPSSVKLPNYNRSQLLPGIVHIGVGNFHRAHQSWYLHRLFQQNLNLDWAIIGSGVRSYDSQMRLKLQNQDYLTTLIELDPKGKSIEVVGSMIGYTKITAGNVELIAQMSDPAIRIVTLTVTEGGYYISPINKQLNTGHADIQHDISHPGLPVTAFGAIVAALKNRRDRRIRPFTCQSCDNLQGNGDILKQTIIALAEQQDVSLALWITENVTFPNSMVDCIVPATTDKERKLTHKFGINDAVPVTHENYRQWVLEDSFCNGRPDWQKVGAVFSDRVHDYETMKIRILNGGHQVIAGIGEILSIETIAEIMTHAIIRRFFQKVENQEIRPHVQSVPEFTPNEYVDLIERRFSNPNIVDTTRRVAFDGSSRHPGFILPSVRDCLSQGMPVNGLALVSAAWARYCFGQREDGSKVEANDPNWETLQKQAELSRQVPQTWLEMVDIYGDLSQAEAFAKPFNKWLKCIYERGVETAMHEYLSES